MSKLKPISKVLLAGHRHQERSLEDIKHLLEFLRANGIRFAAERLFGTYLRNNGFDLSEMEITDLPDPEAGAVISIGGDGSFMRAARWVGSLEIPVLGINTGHLGFLASYTPSEMPELVEMLHNGSAEVESRMALMVDLGKEGDKTPQPPLYALNEVAILKEDTASMINVNTTVNGHYLADYLADGLIVSTPAGSTGYNLSAGGPILSPTLNAICITPIAPHTLTFRPLVVDARSIIEARTTSRASHYRVSLDGISFLMDVDTLISIRKADFTPRVIRRDNDSFADTLRNKLLWGRRN